MSHSDEPTTAVSKSIDVTSGPLRRADHDYRPDIDGLRGIAVLAVILFHSQLGVSGGFVGVDIFFVISGYLISAIILREIRDGRFSFGNFWERRIRRILPAATVMTVATVVIAWFLFMPADLEALGRCVAAQASMVSNVFFWQHAGYFAPAMDTKPLLHTWSLAIEEQFYLFFPLLLVPLARQRKVSLPTLVVSLALVPSFSVFSARIEVTSVPRSFCCPRGLGSCWPARSSLSRTVNGKFRLGPVNTIAMLGRKCRQQGWN